MISDAEFIVSFREKHGDLLETLVDLPPFSDELMAIEATAPADPEPMCAFALTAMQHFPFLILFYAGGM